MQGIREKGKGRREKGKSRGGKGKGKGKGKNKGTEKGKGGKKGTGTRIGTGKGEEASGGRDKDSNLANAYEAVVGALFLDGGFQVAKDFVLEAFRIGSASSTDMLNLRPVPEPLAFLLIMERSSTTLLLFISFMKSFM